MQGNENRRKSEVVRQLIDKMICRFDDNSWELIDVEIIPKTGQPWSSQRNDGTAKAIRGFGGNSHLCRQTSGTRDGKDRIAIFREGFFEAEPAAVTFNGCRTVGF